MNQPERTNIQEAINRTLLQIRAAETRFNRTPNSVSLLAVSKTKPVEAIMEAINAGQRAFGENYVDEAVRKITTVNALLDAERRPHCEWHFIGAVQSNKTRPLAEHTDWVHTIDRKKIAQRLSDHRPIDRSPLNCCVQLNLDKEESKAGVGADDLPELCEWITSLPRLRLRGLMIIPAPRESMAEQRQIFAQVQKLFQIQRQSWPSMDTLSMGMSSDIDAAIAEGSTMVRVGTALFGARNRSN